MKEIKIVFLVASFCITAFFIGCQKEIKPALPDGKLSAEQIDLANKLNIFSPCRLLSWNGLDDGYARTLHYNNAGLMDSWHETAPLYDEDILFTIEYDKIHRLRKIKYYDHNDFLYTIIPVYKLGRITEELWYNGDTQDMYDKFVNTYNILGRIVKRESILNFYYATFKYDLIGNNTFEVVRDTNDGTLYDSTIEAFTKPVIEPMTAAPGMPYPIPFINYVICPLKYTSLDQYYEDGDGNRVESYKQDNSKSMLKAFPNHYASFYDTYDLVSGLENRQVWHYEDCGFGSSSDLQSANAQTSSGFSNNSVLIKQRPMIFETVPQINQRILQIRNQKNKSQ